MCGDDDSNTTDKEDGLDCVLSKLDMCVHCMATGPLSIAGQSLAEQTCCHQQLVKQQKQWGWVSVLSVSHSSMQSSRNVFLLYMADKKEEDAS